MNSLRIALILPISGEPWYLENLRTAVAALAHMLAAANFRVEIVGDTAFLDGRPRHPNIGHQPVGPDPVPTYLGPGPSAMTEGMRYGYRVARQLAPDPPDFVLVPLRSGTAQPIVMARATGEAFPRTTMCLWGDAPTATRIAVSNEPITDPGILVCDAAERTALRLADAIIVASEAVQRAVASIAPADTAFYQMPLGTEHRVSWGNAAEPVREICYVGPASQNHGLSHFLNAVEKIGRQNLLRGRCVTLLGPLREDGRGISKRVIGIRARNWNFDFKIVDANTPSQALAYLTRPGMLPVLTGAVRDDDSLVEGLIAAGIPCLIADDHPLSALLEPANSCRADGNGIAAGLTTALSHGLPTLTRGADGGSWPALLTTLHDDHQPRVAPHATRPSVTVCLNHHDRPTELARALSSVEHTAVQDLSVIVFDNASVTPEAHQALDRYERNGPPQDRRRRVIRSPELVLLPAARNRAAEAADGDIVIFLDDDNLIAPGGLERFRRAFAEDQFDIVVTCLDMFERVAGPEHIDERLLFLGDAASAGLFFNCFGDGNLAVRRDRFLRIGGFDESADVSDDWVFLAKARAAGLRIGVLQTPAIRYARDDRDQFKWRKHDHETPRSVVLRAYSGAFDVNLIARLAQGLALPLY